MQRFARGALGCGAPPLACETFARLRLDRAALVGGRRIRSAARCAVRHVRLGCAAVVFQIAVLVAVHDEHALAHELRDALLRYPAQQRAHFASGEPASHNL